MSVFTRNLIFHSKDLGAEATLLLTFDLQPMSGIYTDFFPVAWRVSTFGATGQFSMGATYKNQLAFIIPQVVSGNIIVASSWIDIDVGQSTNLTEDASGVLSFSSPTVPSPPNFFQAVNDTSIAQSIAFGFDTGKPYPPVCTLFFDSVGASSGVVVPFTPVLNAYVVSNYQQGEILRGVIQTPVIWRQDLATLQKSSSFHLTYDAFFKTYAITQDWSAKAVIRPVLGVGASNGDEIKNMFNVLAETLGDPRQLEAMVKDPQNRAEKLKLLRRLETLTGLMK